MSIGRSRYLGLAAIAVAVVGLVGLGAYGIAVSCGEKASVAKAEYASAEKATDGKSCASVKSALARLASSKKADKASACASKKTSAALASAGDESGCAAKRASALAMLAGADEYACDPAECDDLEKAAQYTLASSESDGEYVCTSKKAKAAALASAEGSSCSSSKSASSSVHLVSAKDGASCAAHKSAKTAKSAEYASAGDISCAADASLCETYAACSVNSDLMTAKGAKLEKFMTEKEQDGVLLTDMRLPEFEARTLEGKKISSKALVGTPTALVMLASHCGHSYQSIAVLEEASEKFSAQGLRVVGLMVGADQKVAKSWFEKSEGEFQVWTADASVADKLESHLVPTYVLIDANGNIRQKLVGYKKNTEVATSLTNLLALDVNAEWVRSKKKS